MRAGAEVGAWDRFAMRNIGFACNGAWHASSAAMLPNARGLCRKDRQPAETRSSSKCVAHEQNAFANFAMVLSLFPQFCTMDV